MPIETELQRRKDSLEAELRNRLESSDLRAIQTHWLAIFLMVVALGCGVVAGIGGLTNTLTSHALGVLALIPSGIAIAVAQFKPQARSSWHYRKSNALNALIGRLLYQLPVDFNADHIAAISEAQSELTKRMQNEWDKEFQFNWTAFQAPRRHTP